MILSRQSCIVLLLSCTALLTFAMTGHADEPVKVYIMAGQSNMQGKASLVTLAHQIKDETRKDTFEHLHDGEGNYLVRDDVFINFLDRHGKLEVGYGSRGRFGPELGFGWTVGEATEEPVLIIKAAYGGRSLFRDFRSPSAGLPSEQYLEDELAKSRNRTPDATMDDITKMYGFAYRDMMGEVENVMENYETLFPELKGKELELAGFVWFQGWNDMINDTFSEAYTENMVHFVNDVRSDLRKPDLPFIIGQLGVGGPFAGEDRSADKKERFKSRQMAAAEKLDHCSCVVTDRYWDPVANEAYKVWREDIDAWRHHGDDHAYHYLGSPLIIYRIGEAFGNEMLRMNGGE